MKQVISSPTYLERASAPLHPHFVNPGAGIAAFSVLNEHRSLTGPSACVSGLHPRNGQNGLSDIYIWSPRHPQHNSKAASVLAQNDLSDVKPHIASHGNSELPSASHTPKFSFSPITHSSLFPKPSSSLSMSAEILTRAPPATSPSGRSVP